MRPKIVIITFVVAFAALALVAVLKGTGPKSVSNEGPTNGATNIATDASADTNATPTTVASTTTPVSDEMRAAVIDREVDEIRTLASEADGSNNPAIIATLVAKLAQPGPEIHQAVLEGLRTMNDTNAIPPLQNAANSIQDAREKVAVLDVIDYLRLPSITDNVPEELQTNNAATNGSRHPIHGKRGVHNPSPGEPQ